MLSFSGNERIILGPLAKFFWQVMKTTFYVSPGKIWGNTNSFGKTIFKHLWTMSEKSSALCENFLAGLPKLHFLGKWEHIGGKSWINKPFLHSRTLREKPSAFWLINFGRVVKTLYHVLVGKFEENNFWKD